MIDVGGFGLVDEAGDAEAYARWMDHQRRAGPDRAMDLLALDDDARVLDLGCGTGVDLRALARRGARPVGLDRSMSMARLSRDRTADDGARVVVADGGALPFGVAVDRAVEAAAITAEEAERYVTSLTALDERGAFVFTAMSMSTLAVVPAEGGDRTA